MTNAKTYNDFNREISASLGYANYAIMGDSGVICLDCFDSEKAIIVESTNCNIDDSDLQWRVMSIDANWENSDLCCDNCNKNIKPNYCEE